MQNKTIVEQVRKIAGNRFANKLKKEIEKKTATGKAAIAALIKGYDLDRAVAESGIEKTKLIRIVRCMNRVSGSWKDIRYKNLLPSLKNGEPDLSVLPIIYPGYIPKKQRHTA